MHNNYVISSLLPHVCLGISCTNSSIPPSTWRDQAGDYPLLINALRINFTLMLLWDLQPWYCLSCLCPTFLSQTGFLAQVLKEYWQVFLLFSPNYHEEPDQAERCFLHKVRSCTRQQWGRSDAEGHEGEPFRNQNKFINNSTDQRLAAGIPAGLKIAFLNCEIQAGIPVTAITWTGTRNVATPICPFSSLPLTAVPMIHFFHFGSFIIPLSCFSHHVLMQQSHAQSSVLWSRTDNGWVTKKVSVGNKILGLTLFVFAGCTCLVGYRLISNLSYKFHS